MPRSDLDIAQIYPGIQHHGRPQIFHTRLPAGETLTSKQPPANFGGRAHSVGGK
jgi:hypothetical protein